MDNLIFIGLPGCGKSTIGAMVAKALALPFYDADIVTERLAGFLWEAHSKRQRLSLWRFVTSGLDRIFL